MKNSTKEAWEKPKLEKILLSADEILGVGCKTGPGDLTGVIPASGCIIAPCTTVPGS